MEQIVRAHQATLAILLAGSNVRAYLGIILLTVSPCAEIAYKLFDVHAGHGYWNTYFFLYEIGPHFNVIIIATGLFFLFRTSNKLRFAVIIPVAYQFSKILWLCTVSSNEDFHRVVPWSFLIIGISVSILWFMLFDYLMTLHFHKRMGAVSRILGILEEKVKLDDHTRVVIAQNELKKLKELI